LDLLVSKPHIGEGVTTRSSSAIHPMDGNDRRILPQAPQQDPEEDLEWWRSEIAKIRQRPRSPAPNLNTQKHFNEWYVLKGLGNLPFDGTQPNTSATATIDAPAHDSAVVNSSEIQKSSETNANLSKDALAKKKRKHGVEVKSDIRV
jgi:hypothetical protein